MDTKTDVVIVGAGPTGLLLAGDLAAAGVATTVLESRVEESGVTRAFALHARTLEQLDARGLADELVATGRRVAAFNLFSHLDLDLSKLPTRFPYVLITPQYNTERVLLRRAEAAGARIVRGARVTEVRQDADGVEVRTEGAGSGTVRARYAVGTDGVRSTVRDALGLDFPGRAVVRSLMLADVRLTDAPDQVLSIDSAGDCFAFVAPFGDGWFRVFAWDRGNPLPDTAPVDLAEVRSVTQRALGSDFGMCEPRWLSRFHCDERQVERYRVGRVFLAGDAAHVHTPAGGQGMNTGLQDAANLGWKLAAVVQGRAPAGLLDTYHAERHPVGRTVVRVSGALIRLVMIKSAAGRATRDTVVGTALRLGPVVRRAGGVLSGIGVDYPAPSGSHRLTGRRAPDLPLADDGSGPLRLYEALRGGEFVLVTPEGGTPALPSGWRGRVRHVFAADPSGPTRLVRPDGHLAWAADDPDPAAVSAALTAWCGRG